MNITNKINRELRGDRVIWMIVALLAFCSVLSVYSSTGTIAYKMKEGNTTYYVIKQVLTLGCGIFFAYLCYLLHYMKYSKWAPWLLVTAIGLLLATLLFGTEINSARRWLRRTGSADGRCPDARRTASSCWRRRPNWWTRTPDVRPDGAGSLRGCAGSR